eukprot:462789-Rhodomonas_salina.1
MQLCGVDGRKFNKEGLKTTINRSAALAASALPTRSLRNVRAVPTPYKPPTPRTKRHLTGRKKTAVLIYWVLPRESQEDRGGREHAGCAADLPL